jgi:predicted RNA-binding Zn-ribbon protein involved in translation (DUF1610 family)
MAENHCVQCGEELKKDNNTALYYCIKCAEEEGYRDETSL